MAACFWSRSVACGGVQRPSAVGQSTADVSNPPAQRSFEVQSQHWKFQKAMTDSPASSDDELEHALRLAANDVSKRPDFYKKLVASSVYIIARSDARKEGGGTMNGGETLSIEKWLKGDGTPVIPFFSSLAALQRALDTEKEYVRLPARSFFEMTRGDFLVLDPKSPYGKEFFPNEIETLLATGVNLSPEQHTMAQQTQVLLGQPANYPTKMVESLKAYFETRKEVSRAYLALMHDLSRGNPVLVVGVEIDGEDQQILREAGVVAADSSPHGEAVDICHVNHLEKGLSEYFSRQGNPFYERISKPSLFARLSGELNSE